MAISPPCHTRTGETTDSWITPRWIIDRFGPFDLDPCASIPQPWPCASRQFTISDHGLLQPWDGFVWMNPPYGRALGDWLNRLAMHGHGIACVFARTETKAFFEHVWPVAESVLFLRGRITFCRPDGSEPEKGHNSGGPTVLIAYGSLAAYRLAQGQDLGVLLPVRRKG